MTQEWRRKEGTKKTAKGSDNSSGGERPIFDFVSFGAALARLKMMLQRHFVLSFLLLCYQLFR